MTRIDELQIRIDWLEEHLGVHSTIDKRNFALQCELCEASVELADLQAAARRAHAERDFVCAACVPGTGCELFRRRIITACPREMRQAGQ